MSLFTFDRISPEIPSSLARRLAGAATPLVSVAVMLPWLAVDAAISGAVVAALALALGSRASGQVID